jgi:carboxylate-amine ligase
MTTAAQLRHVFEAVTPFTVGIEDEVLLVDPATQELAPRAQEVLARLAGDGRFKLELPAAQLEIAIPPASGVPEAARLLHDARRGLAQAARDLAQPVGAGAHPFSSGAGELNHIERYRHTIAEYGPVASRELVCALQVHVAVGGAERTLAVYNAARGSLPLLAALAANAPFYEGRDTGLASIRPKLCELLPRQGVPPPIASWEQFAHDLGWGKATGLFAPGSWWWELRPHPGFGTLEFRVPDGQTTTADAAALAAVTQALVAWLAQRHDAGEVLPAHPSWRIAENRWSAARHGVEGAMAELDAGSTSPTRERLHELIDALEPLAAGLGSSVHLAHARGLIEQGGAIAQREVAHQEGLRGLVRWLCGRFLDPLAG